MLKSSNTTHFILIACSMPVIYLIDIMVLFIFTKVEEEEYVKYSDAG